MKSNTHQQDTTVGHVQTPEIVFNHGSLLAGAISESHVAQANSARRRLYGPTLLGSPARRGHSPRMADIFGDAKKNLAGRSVLTMKSASLMSTVRHLPLHPKSTTDISNLEIQSYKPPTPGSETGVPLYPKLDNGTPLYSQMSPDRASEAKRSWSSAKPFVSGSENWKHHFEVGHHHFSETSAGVQQQRVSPAPMSPHNSYFSKPPQISHVQIVPMSSIETPHGTQDDLSSSSASWTGDSEFYMPQHRVWSLPQQVRNSSVPEWLEQLPAEPAGFKQAGTIYDEEEEVVVPLSPEVEIERGSMRKKMRGSLEKKRRLSFAEDDIMDLS